MCIEILKQREFLFLAFIRKIAAVAVNQTNHDLVTMTYQYCQVAAKKKKREGMSVLVLLIWPSLAKCNKSSSQSSTSLSSTLPYPSVLQLCLTCTRYGSPGRWGQWKKRRKKKRHLPEMQPCGFLRTGSPCEFIWVTYLLAFSHLGER